MRDGESIVKRLNYLWQSASGRNPLDVNTINKFWKAYVAALELATMPEPHPPRHPCRVCEGSGHVLAVMRFTSGGVEVGRIRGCICQRCHGSGFYCPTCNSTDDDVLARNWAKGCCDDGWHCGRDSSLFVVEDGSSAYCTLNGCLLCDVWRELRILAFGQQWVTNKYPGEDYD